MRGSERNIRWIFLLVLLVLTAGTLSACSSGTGTKDGQTVQTEMDFAALKGFSGTSGFLTAIEDEPDTVDFQCTTIHYTIAQNVFNRLVEMENDENGNAQILPSLAQSWEISPDRRTYTFHLRKGVTFSNGSALTSSDVLYTFKRLLTYPLSCNRDIADEIVGAALLEEGKTEELKGFRIINDLDFSITLENPFEAFLACLSMPGASILDEGTTRQAENRFGQDAEWTVGTGPFILKEWVRGYGMLLTANPHCWQGPPKCAGLNLLFVTDPEEARVRFDDGELDILNLDDVGNSAEFYFHGDIYQDRLFFVHRISTTYIALNESMEPLNDVRVRKALQLALNREVLLDAAYSGRGIQVNGIMPEGFYGYNPDLPGIPYDPEEAKRLLKEAGLEDGFSMLFHISSASSMKELNLINTAVSMWEKIGVHAQPLVVDESVFMRLRKRGELACYLATWTADYNDPDTFFYTFFGNEENTTFRSLCYPKEDVMERVRAARTIADSDERIAEYQDLEKQIAQEDAAWIPLFSREYCYVTSKRLKGIQASWNGSVKNRYREMSVQEQ